MSTSEKVAFSIGTNVMMASNEHSDVNRGYKNNRPFQVVLSIWVSCVTNEPI